MQCYRERHALVPFIRSMPLEIVLDYLWDFRVTWSCSHKCCTSGFPVVKWQDLSWFGVLVVCGWHSNILLGCGSEISGTSSLECCCKQWLLCSLAILCKCTSPSLHFEITLKIILQILCAATPFWQVRICEDMGKVISWPRRKRGGAQSISVLPIIRHLLKL